jgi:hypothetical protein
MYRQEELFILASNPLPMLPIFRTAAILLCLLTALKTVEAQSPIRFEQMLKQTYGGTPEVTAIGDLDSDGQEDVVLGTGPASSSGASFTLLVFRNSSAVQVLSSPDMYRYSSGDTIRCLAIADLNRDMHKDLIAGYGDSIRVFYQDNSGRLDSSMSFYCGKGISSLAAGDLDNDSYPDLAAAFTGESFLRVFYGRPTGFLSLSYSSPQYGPDKLGIADMNLDGLSDVVLMSRFDAAGPRIYFQNATGTLDLPAGGMPVLNTNWPMAAMDLGDLDSDGRTDIAVASDGPFPDSYVSLWHNDTVSGILHAPEEIPAYAFPGAIGIADFDCDASNEIVTVHRDVTERVTFLAKDSSGSWTPFESMEFLAPAGNPHSLSVGDINGDGRKDVVYAHPPRGLAILLNTTLPDTFYRQDTTIAQQVIRDTLTVNYTYTETKTDTFPGFYVSHTSLYMVEGLLEATATRTDTLLTREGMRCGRAQVSTLFFYSTEHDTSVIFLDTTVTTSVDTLRTSGIATGLLREARIFPNPAKETLWIEAEEPLRASPLSVELLTPEGELILTGQGRGRLSLEVALLPRGLYFLRLTGNRGISTHKVVLH